MRHQPRPPRPATPTPAPDLPDRIEATSMWSPAATEDDLQDASSETPTVAAWLTALATLGETTMRDHEIELRYTQALDALRQKGVEPTPAAIEAWVHQNRPT